MVDVPPKFRPFWPRSQQEALTTLELGVVLRQAMHRIKDKERFTGSPSAVEVSYVTQFPMPDGSEWEITVKRRA